MNAGCFIDFISDTKFTSSIDAEANTISCPSTAIPTLRLNSEHEATFALLATSQFEIRLISFDKGKTLQSWSIPPSTNVLLPAVLLTENTRVLSQHGPSSGKVVAIVQDALDSKKQMLCSWDVSSTELKPKKDSLDGRLAALLPLAQEDSLMAVTVSEGGKLGLLDSNLNQISECQLPLDTSSRIIHACLTLSNDDTQQVVVFAKSSDAVSIQVVALVAADFELRQSFLFPEMSLKHLRIHGDYLATFVSDKQSVKIFHLDSGSLNEIADIPLAFSPLSMEWIDSHHLCLLQNSSSCLVLNIDFCTYESVTFEKFNNEKLQVTLVSSYSERSVIVISDAERLQMFSVISDQPLLIDAIGRLGAGLNVMDVKSSQAPRLVSILNENVTSAQFDADFLTEMNVLTASSENLFFDDNLVYSIFRRVESDATFWPSKTIRQLIRMGCVSSRMVPSGLLKLIVARDPSLLDEILKYVRDISELEIVHSLKQILSVDHGVLSYMLNERRKEWEHDLIEDPCTFPFTKENTANELIERETASDYFVRAHLTFTTSEHFMTCAMRRLSPYEVQLLIQFAHRWLKRFDIMGVNAIASEFDKLEDAICQHETIVALPRLEISHLVTIVMHLTDSHFSDLILNPEFHSFVEGMRSYVHEQVELCASSAALHHVLEKEFRVNSSPAQEKKTSTGKKSKRGLTLNDRVANQEIGLYGIEKLVW